MKKLALLFIYFVNIQLFSQQPPDVIYGELFKDIQMNKIFVDGKTFVDCVPKKDPKQIVKDYLAVKNNPAIRFSLLRFVEENFEIPKPPTALNYVQKVPDVAMHIKNLWSTLKRDADVEKVGSSLLALPNPYIVPGGRFREIYYWDSYFTMLGLKESGEVETIRNMVDNFAFLINKFGHIPNGNRSYYISRSQPPFFSLMVELLAGIDGDKVYTKYLPALKKEYAYWNEGLLQVKPGMALKRIVSVGKDGYLNRYWDESTTPRQESYKEDVEVAEASKRNKIEMYQHLRAGAASGWDFGCRWFADGKNISTIQTTNILPVDLNCLLYHLEKTIAKGCQLKNDQIGINVFTSNAKNRKLSIEKYFYSKALGFYTDYNFKTKKQTNFISPAGMFAFSLLDLDETIAQQKGAKAAFVIEQSLLKDGGIVTSKNKTGQQWDAPNGWAPLQWMTIVGFENCGQHALAKSIALRWIKLNKDVYARTGKLMEKYNVEDTKLEAGGGEYPGQDGFGWTNGVLLALIKKYSAEL